MCFFDERLLTGDLNFDFQEALAKRRSDRAGDPTRGSRRLRRRKAAGLWKLSDRHTVGAVFCGCFFGVPRRGVKDRKPENH